MATPNGTLDEWVAEIDSFKIKASSACIGVQVEYRERIAQIQKQHSTARNQLEK